MKENSENRLKSYRACFCLGYCMCVCASFSSYTNA